MKQQLIRRRLKRSLNDQVRNEVTQRAKENVCLKEQVVDKNRKSQNEGWIIRKDIRPVDEGDYEESPVIGKVVLSRQKELEENVSNKKVVN